MTRLMTAAARAAGLVALLVLAMIGPASAVSSATYRSQVVSSTNEYRVAQGAVAVKEQKCLTRWAKGQAKWMAKHKKLAHRDGRLGKIMKDCRLNAASENIAWNYSSGSKAVDAWKKSSGHAKNMRSFGARYIGVGVARGKNGQWYVSQVFGTPR